MGRYEFNEIEKAAMERGVMPFAVYQFIDKRVVTLVVSDGFCKMFGYEDRAEAYYDMDNDMYKNTHPDDMARAADAAFSFATEGGRYEAVYRYKKVGESEYHIVHALGEHIYTDSGVRLAFIWYTDEGVCEDGIMDPKLSLKHNLQEEMVEERESRISYYDHLTGLPGMTYFYELVMEKLLVMKADGECPALIYFDLCGMKYFNRKHGFSEGDKLLQSFAWLLAETYGNDNCCRLGQDHFAVFSEENGLEERLNGLFEAAKKLNDGMTLYVHAGIHLHRMEEVGVSTACDRAKQACDSIRSIYDSGFAYFDISMRDEEDLYQYIIANIDRAIEEQWITVYYQPIVRAVNGKVCDEEALARWVDPVRGLLQPSAFIPVLEESHLIYKLDLYILDVVLEKLDIQRNAGLHLVPQSINLSRSDFDSCDIVEEIRKRVDDSDFDRSLITIEITESIVAQNFDFMVEQINRFKDLGFSVWMDDFGSGYSSLDVLQNIRFDLIKFDMRFMRQFDEKMSSRVILTELMKLAASLGTDTVCEGVETEEQVRFLREIGCSKIQGFYYCKPIPLDKLLERYATGSQIGFENPAEEKYYTTIGRINLHNLDILSQGDIDEFNNLFSNLPMSILEFKEKEGRVARTNQSFRDFLSRYYNYDLRNDKVDHYRPFESLGKAFLSAIKQTCVDGKATYVDDRLPDGSMMHAFVRKIADNPANRYTAVAFVILSITDSEQGTNYENIAKALASDFFHIFYVNLETDRFIEYTSIVGEESMTMERFGDDFFGKSQEDADRIIHRDDLLPFKEAFTKENVIRTMEEKGKFMMQYRLLRGDEYITVNIKAIRMPEDKSHIIFGVNRLENEKK